jgi:hypothetical protein
MESQEAGFPPFPRSLEIPLGFPHSHDLDCWDISKNTAQAQVSSEIKTYTAARDL